MIQNKYLEQALRIRRDFKNTDNQLLEMKDSLLVANKSLQESHNKLKEIKENSSEYDSKEELTEDIQLVLMNIEKQAKIIETLYNPLNDFMEELKEEEIKLYEDIVNQYPNESENSIVEQVHKYLKDNS